MIFGICFYANNYGPNVITYFFVIQYYKYIIYFHLIKGVVLSPSIVLSVLSDKKILESVTNLNLISVLESDFKCIKSLDTRQPSRSVLTFHMAVLTGCNTTRILRIFKFILSLQKSDCILLKVARACFSLHPPLFQCYVYPSV